ncbi:cytochrome P450 [Myxococcus stipitatus]|uniref:cytochrome P450 n=1 Tax=Myxococcus stipitatus TaxID=83455 RepID=UPI0030D548E2
MSQTPDISIFSPTFLANPFPLYQQLREQAPVFWSRELGAWLISRYADVKMLLTDERATPDQKAWSGYPELKNSAQPTEHVQWALDATLLLCHGAQHARMRRFANTPFQSQGCGRIARVTEQVVHEVLEGFSGRKEIDLLADFSAPIRIKVMGRLFGAGFKPEEEEFLVTGTNLALGFLEPSLAPEAISRNEGALRGFRALVENVIRRGREAGAQDSILGDLLAPNREGDRLSDEEVLSLVFSFLLAGTEANGSLITMGVLLLLEHSAQLAHLQREPDRYPDAIREILRYRSFTKFLPRYLKEDIPLHGSVMKQGQIALLLFQSAFRDPETFENPDVFDVMRKRQHELLAFGAGPHRCVGERMAEIEAVIALREFFKRFPKATLRGDEADWVKHHMLVAVPRSVPVVPVLLS